MLSRVGGQSGSVGHMRAPLLIVQRPSPPLCTVYIYNGVQRIRFPLVFYDVNLASNDYELITAHFSKSTTSVLTSLKLPSAPLLLQLPLALIHS